MVQGGGATTTKDPEQSIGRPIRRKSENFGVLPYVFFSLATVAAMVLCICVGSVNIPPSDIWEVLTKALSGQALPEANATSIILTVRLPRVLCVALVGAALSLCGASMQGLLRNPLADGTTLGVNSGAALGAVVAIAFGISVPFLPFAGTMIMAMIGALLTLAIILSLSSRMDYSLSTNTIILIGVIFTMFANSIISFIITFKPEKLHSITFWTMGSLAQSSYMNVLILLVSLLAFGGVLVRFARELNAFAVGEDNARHVGVNVRRVKQIVMVMASCLIGVCVSIGGSIGFVGLVMPHMARRVVGPNHKRLLPASLFSGAIFLMLADLAARTLLRPLELPLGVVTSFIGSFVFIYIFYRTRKAK
ncbi:MAG: iron ABC transporter permease [Coriobacteriales bacterium]|jgi:iron complex transport system permease protein|nr:iron ABC transporter permease [Coriobacteriales bacterium]